MSTPNLIDQVKTLLDESSSELEQLIFHSIVTDFISRNEEINTLKSKVATLVITLISLCNDNHDVFELFHYLVSQTKLGMCGIRINTTNEEARYIHLGWLWVEYRHHPISNKYNSLLDVVLFNCRATQTLHQVITGSKKELIGLEHNIHI